MPTTNIYCIYIYIYGHSTTNTWPGFEESFCFLRATIVAFKLICVRMQAASGFSILITHKMMTQNTFSSLYRDCCGLVSVTCFPALCILNMTGSVGAEMCLMHAPYVSGKLAFGTNPWRNNCRPECKHFLISSCCVEQYWGDLHNQFEFLLRGKKVVSFCIAEGSISACK